MANFEIAVDYVLKNEGGYTPDNGNPTNFGISLRFLQSLPDDEPLKKIHPKDLTREQAIDLYLKYFWQRGRYSLLDDLLLSTKVFDFGVNSGINESIKLLQRSYNSLSPNNPILVDGVLGPKTAEAVNSVSCAAMLRMLIQLMIDFYKSVVAHNPNKKDDLNGWINRANKVAI